MCDCTVCVRGRRLLDLAVRAGNKEADVAFVDSIQGDLENAETSAVYWRMKYEGTWPNCYHETEAA